MQTGEGETQLITAAQRADYVRDGYMVFDPEIPDAVLDGVVSDLDGKFSTEPRVIDGTSYAVDRIQDAWRISANVKSIALAPKVLAVLESLYGRKPLPFQTLNFEMGTEQGAHSDTVHFNCTPSGYMCGVWVALEDIDMDVGPVVYYPGSHRLPEVTLDDLGLRVKWMTSAYYDETMKLLARLGSSFALSRKRNEMYRFIYPGYYEPFMARVAQRSGLSPRYATIRKGQAFLWAANLLHGGSPQKDKTRTRNSQVSHYFFEGCEYHTPLLERRDFALRRVPRRRTPSWIR